MAIIFNATTTQGMIVTPDNSGTFQFQSNGSNIATLTAAPAFRARKSANQNIASGTFTKLTFEVTDFNVGNCFDTATSKFTPTVAGYYSITGAVGLEGPSSTVSRALVAPYRNGSNMGYLQDIQWATGSTSQGYTISGSDLHYMNGTTDYLELYTYIGWSGNQQYANSGQTRFSAFLARSA